MGRYSNSKQAHGTSGSPQLSLGQGGLASKVGELYDKLMQTKLIYNRKRNSKVSVGTIVALLLSNDTIVSEIFNRL